MGEKGMETMRAKQEWGYLIVVPCSMSIQAVSSLCVTAAFPVTQIVYCRYCMHTGGRNTLGYGMMELRLCLVLVECYGRVSEYMGGLVQS